MPPCEAGGCQTGRTVASDVGALLSVLTSADPIPEVDARKESDVATTETESRNVAGDGGADVVKEVTVPQVTSLPTPTTEAAPGPAKDVTVDDEGAMNGASAPLVSDPLPPRSEAACTSAIHPISPQR